MCCLILQPAPACISTLKITEVFPIIHLVIEVFVTFSGLFKYTYGQLVLVQVAVKWDREHDAHPLGACAALHVEDVIGQQAHSTGGSVVVFGESAHLGFGAADGGLRGVLGEATAHVHLGVDEAVLPSDVGDFDGAVSVGCKSG